MIDDLTVRNNKMRQKLKRYEKLHCSPLRKEMLFEVRMHGLQSRWKRDLEQTLRSFTSTMEGASNRPATLTVPLGTSLGPDPGGFSDKPSWSSTSYHKPVDSAYASISASGQTQISQSAHTDGKFQERLVESFETHPLHFKSHLHDAQQAFSSQRLRFISVEAKQKLIVWRLEQLFTNRLTSTTRDLVSLQKQMVSYSAASGEIKATEVGDGSIEMEGVREARILTDGPELSTEGPEDDQAGTIGRDENDSDDPMGGETVAGSPEKSEQRPTWPLDLDIYRAQAPEEAMRYIRHLGPYCSSSWIYLNLLSNMAQLHFLNVTPEFVRKAVTRFSSKFELSQNGQKLRWKGGNLGTGLGSESETNAEPGGKCSPGIGDGPSSERKRTRESSPSHAGTWAQSDVNCLSQVPNYNSSAGAGAVPRRRPDFLTQFNRAADFQYKPLLFHAARSERDDDYDYDDDSLTSGDGMDSMAGAVPLRKRIVTTCSTSRRRGSICGPIIFYNRANFCVDLSADPSLSFNSDIMRSPCTNDPVGCHMTKPDDDFGSKGSRRRLIQEPLLDDSAKDGNENDDVSMVELNLTMEQSEPKTDAVYDGLSPIYMEASGLGGVQPQDNFSINVQVRHGSASTRLTKVQPSCRNPCRVQRVLQDLLASANLSSRENLEGAFQEAEILLVTTTLLAPSTLPEPSYCLTLCSEDGEDSDDDDSYIKNSDEMGLKRDSTISSVEEDEIDVDFLMAQSHSESSPEPSLATSSEASLEEDDDSSIDLLAHARVLDPATVAARELEFETNNGQMLAEVPAGSSAATVRGGSEFSSEYSSSLHMFEDEARPKDKRRRTVFTAAVLGTKN